MKFTEQQMETIHRNLVISRCPNCGNADEKYIFPESANIGGNGNPLYEAIVARCPQCGFIFLFNLEFILNKG